MMRAFVVAMPLAFLVSCGQSHEGSMFYSAARRQYSLDNESMMIYTRGPTWDGGDPAITAKSNLDGIQKTFVPLYGLTDVEGALQGFYSSGLGYGLKVQYTSSNTQSPVFSSWAGNDLNANSKEFKAFMAYAHLSRVHKMLFDEMPSLQAQITGDNVKYYPLKAFVATPGHVLDTVFSYKEATGSVINFYQHNKKAGLEKLNMVDEADASYHEFGHYIQNLYNPAVLALAVSNAADGQVVNPDLDAIIEGTADYLSAAITKSERIHVYLENNMAILQQGLVVRQGSSNRSLSKSWGFPETYIFDGHMDGRVISSTINDLRKFLSNQEVAVRNCTPVGSAACVAKLNYDITTVSDFWMKSFELSMLTFGELETWSTYWDFSMKLMTTVKAFVESQGCTGTCATDARAELLSLLSGRGLIGADRAGQYKSTNVITQAQTGTAATKKIKVGASFNFVPFATSNGLSNGDDKLSECEVFIAMPDLYNNTNVVGPASDLYNIHFRVKASTNLQEVKDADGAVVEFLTGDKRKWKSWGILPTGQRGVNYLVSSSSAFDWFDATNGSHFAKPASLTNFPVNWGYLVSVPRNRAGAAISITWEVYFQPKDALTNAIKSKVEFTQTLTVDSTLTFCN